MQTLRNAVYSCIAPAAARDLIPFILPKFIRKETYGSQAHQADNEAKHV
jgi:hypothetical protein